ncbi:phage integrase N-terminal SAM-like domain-containing protein [Abyssogena phaseoliformis symbiont]|uniref:phage integrase N-terminal SAM-like domain-containing protein n=1 Tax=Abyssogena phaseoliformis symbiont TaxID=596095 RepID=UPI001914E2A7
MQFISKQDINNQLTKYHYSQNTVLIYQSWILRFVKYHHLKSAQFNLSHIEKYLSHLLNKKN